MLTFEDVVAFIDTDPAAATYLRDPGMLPILKGAALYPAGDHDSNGKAAVHVTPSEE